MSMPARPLQGKRVLITSASQGIGKATALAFAAAGADVAVNGRSAERLAPVVEAARQLGVRAVAVEGDLTQPDQWERVVQGAVDGLGGLDVLVNNGPGVDRSLPVFDANSDPDSDEQYESTLRVNVRAAAALMRHAAPHMAKAGGGSVINVSSTCGAIPTPAMGAYCVAKAALEMLTKLWALKLAKDKVRVNAVQPSFTLTPAIEGAISAGFFSAEQVGSYHPMGRASTPEEQASVIVFLASEAASFMTGAIVPVDGGALCTVWATKP